jgi:hypothetical protein
MSSEEPFNKYAFALELLRPHLIELGGEILATCFGNDQIEWLKENDPAQATSAELMRSMLGSLKDDTLVTRKYVGLSEVMKDLANKSAEQS